MYVHCRGCCTGKLFTLALLALALAVGAAAIHFTSEPAKACDGNC